MRIWCSVCHAEQADLVGLLAHCESAHGLKPGIREPEGVRWELRMPYRK